MPDSADLSPAPTPKLTFHQRRWQIQILLVTYFGYIGYYFCRKAYSLCKAPIAVSLELDKDTEATLLGIPWMVFLFCYMAGQFINGALGRKLGSRVLLVVGMAGTLFCSIGFGLANSMAAFTCLMALNGLFQSSGWPASVGAVAPWLREHERGKLMGLWTTNYSFGSMAVKAFVAQMLGVTLITGVAVWQTAFWSCSLMTLIIWVLVVLFQRNKPEDVGLPPFATEKDELAETTDAGEIPTAQERSFFSILFTPTVLMMGAVYFCLKFLRYAIDSWLPYMFHSEFQLDYRSSGFYSLVFDMLGIAGGIAAGWALDKVFRGRWRGLCLLMVIGMVGCYLLVYLFGHLHPVVLSVLTGFVGFMLFGPDTILAGAASISVGGKHEAIAAAGIINGIGSIGPIVQELVVARLLDQYDKSMTPVNILFLSMACVSAFLLGILYVRQRRRDRVAALASRGSPR